MVFILKNYHCCVTKTLTSRCNRRHMWKIFTQNQGNDERQFDDLLAGLREVRSESLLSEEQKSLMKMDFFEARGILDRENSVERPVEVTSMLRAVRAVAVGRLLSGYQKKMLLANVMARTGRVKWSWQSGFWLFRNWRSSLASLLVFVMVLTSLMVVPMDLRVTRASKWTFLEKVDGEAFVNRNDKIIPVYADFALQEGDMIFTSDEGFVTIRYLDDSVTRLGENTTVTINRLYVRPDNAVQTEVKVQLLGGYLWASVYNLVNNQSRFTVETSNVRANVSDKAAFAVSTDKGKTTLSVFENTVDVSNKQSVSDTRSVVAGFQAEVTEVSSQEVHLPMVVQKNQEQGSGWVVANLDLDQKHQEKLLQENLQFASDAVASHDGTFGLLADIRDTTKLVLTNAKIESARQRFMDAHLGIIRAQELLNKANEENQLRRQVVPLVLQYKTAVREIMNDFIMMRDENMEQADKLLGWMREEIDLQRKALSLVMPGDKLYVVKDAVNESGYFLALNSANKASYLLDRARNRLLETQTLIVKDDIKGAEAVFRKYLAELDVLIEQVDDSQVRAMENGLFALFDEQIRQLKVLAAMESELIGKKDQNLLAMVVKVRNDSLEKLVNIFHIYRQKKIPFGMVLSLRNLIEEYVPYSRTKILWQARLDEVLDISPNTEVLEQDVSSDGVALSAKRIDEAELKVKAVNCLSDCGDITKR